MVPAPTLLPLPMVQATRPLAVKLDTPSVLLSDGRFVYTGDSTADILAGFPGPLRDLQVEDVDGHVVPVSEIIDVRSDIYTVSPEVLLTLAEMSTGALRNPTVPPDDLNRLMGNADPAHAGVWEQIEWAAQSLGAGFYEHYSGHAQTRFLLKDGTPPT